MRSTSYSEINRLLKVKVTQSCPTLCDRMDYTLHGILWARIPEWVAFPFSKGSSHPRDPTLQVDSLPAESQGKPKNTGVDSLSLLQGVFRTQELNRTSLVAQRVKCLPTVWETWVQSLGQEDLLEKGMATHSSILGLPLWLSW